LFRLAQSINAHERLTNVVLLPATRNLQVRQSRPPDVTSLIYADSCFVGVVVLTQAAQNADTETRSGFPSRSVRYLTINYESSSMGRPMLIGFGSPRSESDNVGFGSAITNYVVLNSKIGV